MEVSLFLNNDQTEKLFISILEEDGGGHRFSLQTPENVVYSLSFCNYEKVVLDKKDDLLLYIVGNDDTKKIKFTNRTFLDEFIQQLKLSTNNDIENDCLYINKNKKGGYFSVTDMIGKRLHNGVYYMKNIVTGLYNEEGSNVKIDGLTMNYIYGVFPSDINIVELNSEQCTKEMLGSISIASHSLTRADMIKLWITSLDYPLSKENLENYKKIELQWQSLTKGQWLHSRSTRVFVKKLELYIIKSKITIKKYDEILFHVFMSIHAFFFSLFDIVDKYIYFFEVFVSLFIQDSVDGNSFASPLHDSLSFDEVCCLLFWNFKSFLQRFCLGKSDIYKLGTITSRHMSVLTQLSSVSPSTHSVIVEVCEKNLSFIDEAFDYLFTKDRNIDDALLILTSIICSDSPQKLMECMATGAIVLQQGVISDTQYDDSYPLDSIFSQNLLRIQARLLLLNAEKLLGFKH